MNYHLLGQSSLRVSEIGFGCMSLKNYDAAEEQLLHRALEKGINFFDTADLYDHGKNEEFLGKTFQQKRSEIIIATKVGNQWRKDGSGWDWNPNKDYIIKSVEESLQRLQTDYIDLYQLHGGTIDDPIDDTIEAFETLKKEGKILFYGISSIRPNVIREYVEKSFMISVMLQYSLLDRRPEESVLALLEQNRIGILARGSMAQGLLIDKPAKEYLDHSADEVQSAAEAVRQASGKERSKANTALRYVLQQPAVTSVIAGIRTLQQLEEAVQAIDTPELNEEEMQLLQASVKTNVYQQHR